MSSCCLEADGLLARCRVALNAAQIATNVSRPVCRRNDYGDCAYKDLRRPPNLDPTAYFSLVAFLDQADKIFRAVWELDKKRAKLPKYGKQPVIKPPQNAPEVARLERYRLPNRTAALPTKAARFYRRRMASPAG